MKPMLNRERIEQTDKFMEDFKQNQERSTIQINRRKSFSKRVTESFTVDLSEVQESVNRLTRDENLPSNRAFRPADGHQPPVAKKAKGKTKEEA